MSAERAPDLLPLLKHFVVDAVPKGAMVLIDGTFRETRGKAIPFSEGDPDAGPDAAVLFFSDYTWAAYWMVDDPVPVAADKADARRWNAQQVMA